MIGFAGLSHLGIVSSIAVASKDFQVIAYDPRREVCDLLAAGQLPILEPGLSELLANACRHLRFTAEVASLAECDLIYFSLDVQTDAENGSDLSGLRRLIDDVVVHIKPGATLVVLSQVPPGFTRQLSITLADLLEERRAQLFCQVETLIFGAAVERAVHPERYIVGSNGPPWLLSDTYTRVLSAFGCPVLVMRYESAELAKISINVLLAASLSATNTLAELCEAVGADWSEIAPTLRLDRRIGAHAYLSPGLGIAGGNIERDLVTVRSLAAQHGAEDCVPRAFVAHSQHRRDWALRMLHKEVLSRRSQPVIAIWGLAYKPNTTSIKNSPTLSLLDALRGFSVRLYDPCVSLDDVPAHAVQASSAVDACRGAHALVIMTAWDEFSTISTPAVKEALTDAVVIDAAGAWSGRDTAASGLVYSTMGRPSCNA